MLCTIEVTVQLSQPLATDAACAGAPLTVGCVAQVTPVSVQLPTARYASIVRPVDPEVV
jgi:hypothetical protein